MRWGLGLAAAAAAESALYWHATADPPGNDGYQIQYVSKPSRRCTSVINVAFHANEDVRDNQCFAKCTTDVCAQKPDAPCYCPTRSTNDRVMEDRRARLVSGSNHLCVLESSAMELCSAMNECFGVQRGSVSVEWELLTFACQDSSAWVRSVGGKLLQKVAEPQQCPLGTGLELVGGYASLQGLYVAPTASGQEAVYAQVGGRGRAQWHSSGCGWVVEEQDPPAPAVPAPECTDDLPAATALFGGRHDLDPLICQKGQFEFCGNEIFAALCALTCSYGQCSGDRLQAADALGELRQVEAASGRARCSDMACDLVVARICEATCAGAPIEDMLWTTTPRQLRAHRRALTEDWQLVYATFDQEEQCLALATSVPQLTRLGGLRDVRAARAPIALATAEDCPEDGTYLTIASVFCPSRNIHPFFDGGRPGFELDSRYPASTTTTTTTTSTVGNGTGVVLGPQNATMFIPDPLSRLRQLQCAHQHGDEDVKTSRAIEADALCADRQTCEEVCASLPDCGSIDMHVSKDICYLNFASRCPMDAILRAPVGGGLGSDIEEPFVRDESWNLLLPMKRTAYSEPLIASQRAATQDEVILVDPRQKLAAACCLVERGRTTCSWRTNAQRRTYAEAAALCTTSSGFMCSASQTSLCDSASGFNEETRVWVPPTDLALSGYATAGGQVCAEDPASTGDAATRSHCEGQCLAMGPSCVAIAFDATSQSCKLYAACTPRAAALVPTPPPEDDGSLDLSGEVVSGTGICWGNDSRCGHNVLGTQVWGGSGWRSRGTMSEDQCLGCRDGCDCRWVGTRRLTEMEEFRQELAVRVETQPCAIHVALDGATARYGPVANAGAAEPGFLLGDNSSRLVQDSCGAWVVEANAEEVATLELPFCLDAPQAARDYLALNRSNHGLEAVALSAGQTRFVCQHGKDEGRCTDPVFAALCGQSCAPKVELRIGLEVHTVPDTRTLLGGDCRADDNAALALLRSDEHCAPGECRDVIGHALCRVTCSDYSPPEVEYVDPLAHHDEADGIGATASRGPFRGQSLEWRRRRTPAPTPGAPAVPYVILASSVCEVEGMETITDLDECLEAGAHLAGATLVYRFDQPAGGYADMGTDRTRGCTFNDGNLAGTAPGTDISMPAGKDLQLFPMATGICGTENFLCICRTAPGSVPSTPVWAENALGLRRLEHALGVGTFGGLKRLVGRAEGQFLPLGSSWAPVARQRPIGTCQQPPGPGHWSADAWYAAHAPPSVAALYYVCRGYSVCPELTTCVLSEGRLADELLAWRGAPHAVLAKSSQPDRQQVLEDFLVKALVSESRCELRMTDTYQPGGVGECWRNAAGATRVRVQRPPPDAAKMLLAVLAAEKAQAEDGFGRQYRVPPGFDPLATDVIRFEAFTATAALATGRVHLQIYAPEDGLHFFVSRHTVELDGHYGRVSDAAPLSNTRNTVHDPSAEYLVPLQQVGGSAQRLGEGWWDVFVPPNVDLVASTDALECASSNGYCGPPQSTRCLEQVGQAPRCTCAPDHVLPETGKTAVFSPGEEQCVLFREMRNQNMFGLTYRFANVEKLAYGWRLEELQAHQFLGEYGPGGTCEDPEDPLVSGLYDAPVPTSILVSGNYPRSGAGASVQMIARGKTGYHWFSQCLDCGPGEAFVELGMGPEKGVECFTLKHDYHPLDHGWSEKVLVELRRSTGPGCGSAEHETPCPLIETWAFDKLDFKTKHMDVRCGKPGRRVGETVRSHTNGVFEAPSTCYCKALCMEEAYTSDCRQWTYHAATRECYLLLAPSRDAPQAWTFESEGWASGGLPLTLQRTELRVEPGVDFSVEVRGIGVSEPDTWKRQRIKLVAGGDCAGPAAPSVRGIACTSKGAATCSPKPATADVETATWANLQIAGMQVEHAYTLCYCPDKCSSAKSYLATGTVTVAPAVYSWAGPHEIDRLGAFELTLARPPFSALTSSTQWVVKLVRKALGGCDLLVDEATGVGPVLAESVDADRAVAAFELLVPEGEAGEYAVCLGLDELPPYVPPTYANITVNGTNVTVEIPAPPANRTDPNQTSLTWARVPSSDGRGLVIQRLPDERGPPGVFKRQVASAFLGPAKVPLKARKLALPDQDKAVLRRSCAAPPLCEDVANPHLGQDCEKIFAASGTPTELRVDLDTSTEHWQTRYENMTHTWAMRNESLRLNNSTNLTGPREYIYEDHSFTLDPGRYELCYCNAMQDTTLVGDDGIPLGANGSSGNASASTYVLAEGLRCGDSYRLGRDSLLPEYAAHLCEDKCHAGCEGINCHCDLDRDVADAHRICLPEAMCRDACEAHGDCGGFDVLDGGCYLHAGCNATSNWTIVEDRLAQHFARAPGAACTDPEDFGPERAAGVQLTDRFVGADYVAAPSSEQNVELRVFRASLRDRILLADADSTCGLDGPTRLASLEHTDWSALKPHYDFDEFADPPVAGAREYNYFRVSNVFCTGNNILSDDLEKYGLAGDRCHAKCAAGSEDPHCAGFLSGHDAATTNALCLDETACEAACAAVPECRAFDMSRTLPRCFLNTGDCLLGWDVLGYHEHYDLLVKGAAVGSTGIDRRLGATRDSPSTAFNDRVYTGGALAYDGVLSFGPLDLRAGGRFRVCFCDAERSPCTRHEDFDVDAGALHVSGISCMLEDPRFQRVSCTAQPHSLRCVQA